jgi:CubicO group peptidase (beta-lactamase class C family)
MRCWQALVLVAVALPGATVTGAAEGPPPHAFDAVFGKQVAAGEPGCAVAMQRAGQPLEQRGYGAAVLEHGLPITPDTVFDIGSVSKQFTAAVVVRLAESGALRLDDSVRRHVPELPAHAEPITLRHLLHHTSGLRDYVDLFPLLGVPYTSVVTGADALGLLARESSTNFAAGGAWSYSNSNYFLLALVAERASGRQMADLLREEIFVPAGMTSSSLWRSHQQVVARRAHSYDRVPDGFGNVSYNW